MFTYVTIGNRTRVYDLWGDLVDEFNPYSVRFQLVVWQD